MERALILSVLFLLSIISVHAQYLKDSASMLMSLEDSSLVIRKVEQLLKGTESDQTAVWQYYNLQGKPDLAKQLEKSLIKKFPRGEVASSKLVYQIEEESDAVTLDRLVREYIRKIDSSYFTDMYRAAASSAARTGDIESFFAYWDRLDQQWLREMLFNKNGSEMIKADPKLVHDLLEERVKKFNFDDSNRDLYYYLLQALVDADLALDNSADALARIEMLYLFQEQKSDETLMKYADILVRNQQWNKAFVVLDSLVRAGKGSESISQRHASAYNQLFPKGDFEDYTEHINRRLHQKLQKEVAEKVIKEKSPDFFFTDSSGTLYTLNDFKGKNIILDFWATWCGPCKKSFPAMQKAVNKFKDDSSVKFLFVHTWERTADPIQDAMEYLKENQYDFDLYMDLTDKQSRTNQAVSAFNIQGIPTKIIIDANGYIRYKAAGFDGGEDKVVTEISMLIDYIKKNP